MSESELYRIAFEIYECVDVARAATQRSSTSCSAAPLDLWREMLESIQANGNGADAAHTINTLTHVGDVMKVEYEDPGGARPLLPLHGHDPGLPRRSQRQLDLELG